MRDFRFRSFRLDNFVTMRLLAPILLLLLPLWSLAQDEEYYAPEKTRQTMTTELKDLHRWGPKLGLEANVSIGYSHFYAPSTISGAFYKQTGGFGYDLGLGLRVRIRHKLAIATGFNFSGRGYNIGFPAYAEIDTGGGALVLEFDVYEKAQINYLGFYIKPLIEISRKFHLGILFHPMWQIRYRGRSTQTITSPPPYSGSVGTLVDESSLYLVEKQFELGFEFAYKWVISPEMILKPHIGLNFAVTPIFHTGAELPTPFGGWEQNPSFMTLRFGVIFETGLWLDKLKPNSLR